MCPSRLTRHFTLNDHLIAQDHPNNVEENEPNPEINVEPQETQQPLRRSQRNRQPTNFDDYYETGNAMTLNPLRMPLLVTNQLIGGKQ
ncbi:hypothetical protein Tco_0055455 [Tanacetum coccineum]